VVDDPSVAELLKSLSSSKAQEAWEKFLDVYSPAIFRTIRLSERDEDAIADCFLSVCRGLAQNRFHRLRQFNPVGPARFSTWLRVVVRNLCVDWRRKAFGRQHRFEFVERLSALDQAVFQSLHLDRLSQEEALLRLAPNFPGLSRLTLAERADHILQGLSPRQRWLLSTRAADGGHELTEAAERVADERPSPETVAINEQLRTRLRRAVERLPHGDRLLLQLRFEQEMTLQHIARLLRIGDAQRADRRIREVLERLRRVLGGT
jgi:RNA polymerase sigma factor (sigma-70 family)